MNANYAEICRIGNLEATAFAPDGILKHVIIIFRENDISCESSARFT